MRHRSRTGLLAGLALIGLASCRRPPPEPVTEPAEALRPVAAARLPDLGDDASPESLRLAVSRSLRWLEAQPPRRQFVFGPRSVSADALRLSLEELERYLESGPEPAALAAWVGSRFEVLESVAGDEVLVTGYYEPVIEASLQPDPDYPVPIYGRPDDLIQVNLESFDPQWRDRRLAGRLEGKRLVPYWTRREIREQGVLSERGLELAWARDPVDFFFLEVQGSGALRLPDGSERRIGYAASNGRRYRSIGKLLIDEGALEREHVSMQSIRAWLDGNPHELERVLDYNASCVFFHFLDGPPLGNLGQPVTPGRSIATDQSLFPPAALAWLETERPSRGAQGEVLAGGRLARFVLNQDRGGAIRGPDRVDLFFGRGREAARDAGLMKQPGRLYFLAPRGRPSESP